MTYAAVLTDIEGTATPLRFVTQVLYPYARARLADFVRRHAEEPEVAALLEEVRGEAGRRLDLQGVVDRLLLWMDADRKAAPLKELQGLLWEAGYLKGELLTRVYPDAARRLREWNASGLRLYVYSSGSTRAQRAIFANTDQGDLGPLFSGYFDVRIGHKRDPHSYRRIAEAIGVSPAAILFLSDVREELDAARRAGLKTTWLVREGPVAGPAAAHRQARSFDRIRV